MTRLTSAPRAWRWRSALAALGALAALAAGAAEQPTVVASRALGAAEIYPAGAPAAARWAVAPALVILQRSRWTDERAVAALREAAGILAQCGVQLTSATLYRVDGPERYADFSTAAGRELARRLPFAKPTLYFVRETRQPVPFEAEAIGRGNSATRPELAYTVWMIESVRDPGVALAHELAHVLMDSGEHVELPGNLMRDETDPANVTLTAGQCARLTDSGAALGLLAPSR
ncbi:MAG TPA: hypothetical protein VLW45_02725 [Pelomicrobium sp.]|nr:hypothetical protein [Pelomicrobium sp.]